MRRIAGLIAFGAVLFLHSHSSCGQVLFSENFDSAGASLNWTTHSESDNETPDFLVGYGFNYSSLGISAAPGGSGTVGVKIDTNVNGLAGAEAVNIYPNGQSFSGDYALRFDMWARVSGAAGTTTEDALAGINASGSKTNWLSFSGSSDGIFYGVTGDGGNNGWDYTRYLGTGASDPTRIALFDNTAALPQATFPNTDGTPRNQWTTVQIEQINGKITMKLNGITFDSFTNLLTYTSGNIFLGHQDVVGTATPNSQTFSIFDNLNVLRITRWTSDADGIWTGANWSQAAAPSGNSSIAYLGPAISAPRTITLATAQTVGDLVLDSSISYNMIGPGTLSLSSISNQSHIDVRLGNHTLSTPVAMLSSTQINVDRSLDTLTLSGNQSASAGLTLLKTGAGAVQLPRLSVGTLSIQAGTVRVAAKANPDDPAGTSVIQNLSITSAGRLDLTNNSMIIKHSAASPQNYVRMWLRSGITNGSGIISSSMTANLRLGFAENSLLGLGMFAGQPVDANSLLIKYTYAGDANLDGRVDLSDMIFFAPHWMSSGNWSDGDFNYDGMIDAKDLSLLAHNWQAGTVTPIGATFDDTMAQLGLESLLPEPALPMVAMGLLVICRRRSDHRD
ncbi:MAG TPA: hypothetical protein VHD56_10215 [Tepidisphaeraceae bacterium]|nr:hypothetical protein [Tepidisphaeraceae bacterium]